MPKGVYIKTEEHKKHLGEALKGRIFSEEWRNHLSESHKGKGEAQRGEKNPNWKGGSKVYRKKSDNKRKRNLGFIPLNEFFEGSEFHHIDRERGLFIPIELHKSISHCVETGKNMKEINLVAFDYWSTMSFKHLKERIDERRAFN